MTNIVKLTAGRVELPALGLHHALEPSPHILQQGLEAYQDLQRDVGLQSLPLLQRRQVCRFLRRFGRLLHRTLFPRGEETRLDTRRPLLLEMDAHWAAFPWELLHDGEKWLALEQGVARLWPAPPVEAKPLGLPLRVLGVTANPLALGAVGEPAAMTRFPRSRFISVIDNALDSHGESVPGPEFRPLEHATWEEFAKALEPVPHLLLWSGFAGEQWWLFESEHGEARRAEVRRLARLVRKAAARGLRGLILNDSLGLHDPEGAARQARIWLENGVPALIRIEGCHARVREQDYLRTLTRHLVQRPVLFEGHLAAIRRLSRRFEEGWDWSYFRFYLRGAGTIGDTQATFAAEREARSPRPVGVSTVALGGAPPFAVTPAPPSFSRRQRVFDRHRDLHALAKAILPQQPPASPLIFLTGPPGCGKTVLALEAVRRLYRRFERVIYLDDRAVMPPPSEIVPLPEPRLGEPAPHETLLDALARRLEAHQVLEAAPAEREAILRGYLQDGRERLIVVDRLERHPGYEAFCERLRRLSPRARIVLVSRNPPPLMPGFRVELAPVDEDDLAVVFDEEFLERLRRDPAARWLIAACRRDLLLARLLRRLEPWPDFQAYDPAEGSGRAAGLVTAVLETILAGLGEPSRRVLETLSLLTGLVHHEVLAQVAGLEGRPLQESLTALQWLGIVEAYDGDRYFALPPRLQAPLGRRLMTREIFARLAPRLVRSYRSFLVGAAEALRLAEGEGRPAEHPPLLAWCESPRGKFSGLDARLYHRLGAERINLVELGAILAEESDLRSLTGLMEDVKWLDALPGMRDVAMQLGHYLLGASHARGEEVVQARALNGIGHALIASGRMEEAARVLEGALDILSHRTGWEVLFETYLLLSRCHAALGNHHAAANLLNSAVELAYQLGDGGYLAEALAALVSVWAERGEALEQGEQVLPQAVTYLERRKQVRHAGRIRRLLAGIYLHTGRYDDAETALGLALHGFLEIDDPLEAGLTRFLLAECLIRQGRPEAAWNAFLDAKRQVRDRQGTTLREETRVLTLISRWYEANRRFSEALRGYQQVRRLNEALGDRDGVLRTLDILGGLYFQLGEQEQSTRCYEERLHLQTALGGGGAE